MMKSFRAFVFLMIGFGSCQAMENTSPILIPVREVPSLQDLIIARIVQPPRTEKERAAFSPENIQTLPSTMKDKIAYQAALTLSACLRKQKCARIFNTKHRLTINQNLMFIDFNAEENRNILIYLVNLWPCAEKQEHFNDFLSHIERNNSIGALDPLDVENALHCALERYISTPDSECIADIAKSILNFRIRMSDQPIQDTLFDTIITQHFYDQKKGERISSFIETLLSNNSLTQEAKDLLLEKSFKKARRGSDVYEPLIRSLVRSGAHHSDWSPEWKKQLQAITARS